MLLIRCSLAAVPGKDKTKLEKEQGGGRGKGREEERQEERERERRERETHCKLVLIRLNKLESQPGEGLIKVNRRFKVRESSVSVGEKF